MLTETIEIAGIEVVTATKELQVRYSHKVISDGEVISDKTHYNVLSPGADLTNEDQRVKDIAAAVWA